MQWVSPVAIAHGNLKIEISAPEKKQAPAAEEGKGPKFKLVSNATTIADLVTLLNEIGASADDMVALVQGLKSSGALLADVEIQ